jgi:hypothetical protein
MPTLSPAELAIERGVLASLRLHYATQQALLVRQREHGSASAAGISPRYSRSVDGMVLLIERNTGLGTTSIGTVSEAVEHGFCPTALACRG